MTELRWLSLCNFIERRVKFKEINTSEITKLKVVKMGFDSRTLIPGCSSGFKYIAFQSAFVIVSSLCVSTYLTHLSNSSRILWSWTWKRNKGSLLLKSVLKVSIVVFFSVMSLKHISKKHIFGFGALLKFLQA